MRLRILFILFLFIILTCNKSSQEETNKRLIVSAGIFENGLYAQSQDKTAPIIETQDGEKKCVGSKCKFQIKKVKLHSVNNRNDNFELSVAVPYSSKLERSPWKLLIINKTAYFQIGASSSAKKKYFFHFSILGQDKAKEVAKFFKIQPRYRRHPHHSLAVFFIPIKDKFKKGEEIWVTLKIKNVGNNIITFLQGGRHHAPRDNQYLFSAWYGGRQVDDIGNIGSGGGIAFPIILKPGEIFKDKINLNKWFHFTEQGKYQILGSYYLDFYDFKRDFPKTIWEDYVSAEFFVKIKNEK